MTFEQRLMEMKVGDIYVNEDDPEVRYIREPGGWTKEYWRHEFRPSAGMVNGALQYVTFIPLLPDLQPTSEEQREVGDAK